MTMRTDLDGGKQLCLPVFERLYRLRLRQLID